MRHTASIVVIDADAAMRDLVLERLHTVGYRGVGASSEADAHSALRAVRFALVVADPFVVCTEEATDYWAALERLRVTAGPTPIITCSAHLPGVFADFATHGFAACSPKPVDLDTVVLLVRRTIAQEHGATHAGRCSREGTSAPSGVGRDGLSPALQPGVDTRST